MIYHYDTDDELLALYQGDAAKLAIHRSLLASGFTNSNPHLFVAINTFVSQLSRHGYTICPEGKK